MNLLVEGIKGNGLKDKGRKGCVVVQMKDASYYHPEEIVVDGFEGRGADYKERQTEKITIKHNGKVVSFNSFDEFFMAVEKSAKSEGVIVKDANGALGIIVDTNGDKPYGVLFTDVDEDHGLIWMDDSEITLATAEEEVEFRVWHEKHQRSMTKMTVRKLAEQNPDMMNYDYKWTNSENYRDLKEVLSDYGYRLADEDADIAGEYNDIKAYYECKLVEE